MPTQINTQICGVETYGTGNVECPIRKGKIISIIKTRPLWSFDLATETFDFAYIVNQIQQGNFIPFMNTVDATYNAPDSDIKEYDDNTKAVVNNAKPEYRYEFDNGIFWNKAAASYAGFRNGGVIEIDENSRVWLQINTAKTKLLAAQTNMFNVPTYRPKIGKERFATYIDFQIRNEKTWVTNFASISPEQIGEDLNDRLRGFISMNLEGTASVATGLTLKITTVDNASESFEGFDASNFLVVNTATNAEIPISDATLISGSKDAYIITPSTPFTDGDTIQCFLYDAAATPPVKIAKVGDNQLFKGQTGVITVTA